MELNRIYNEDCLEGMKRIEDKSIDLVVIDPPYNIGKAKWDIYEKNKYISFMSSVFIQCERVLRRTGSFYWFHNDFEQMAKLQNELSTNTSFVFKSLITITKTENSYVKDLYGKRANFRNYINTNEYCMFYTLNPGTGLEEVMGEYENFKTIKKYFNDEKKMIETREGVLLKDKLKWTTHFHWFAQGNSWGMCGESRYEELQRVFEGYFMKPYNELRKEYEELRESYESLRFTFNAQEGIENHWEYGFRKDKQLKHPTQKPINLISDIIKYSSNAGDVVLDCFMGSGTTAIAAMNTKRNFIGFELDETYFNLTNERIKENAKGLVQE